MKSILMSIRPQWVAKILNGEKTIEIRKKFPKDYVGWVYIYCSKDKKYANLINRGGFLTGMVVARFWCDKVGVYHILPTERVMPFNRSVVPLLKNTCLTKEEIMAYGNGDDYYAHLIHITNLEIFDKPKDISEFFVFSHIADGVDTHNRPKQFKIFKHITRPPQSWCYIED